MAEYPRTPDEEVSPSGAGVMFLLWGEPADRALAGWCPEQSFPSAAKRDEKDQLRWLAEQVRMKHLEARDIEDVRSGQISSRYM
jgi:hypothetical protein